MGDFRSERENEAGFRFAAARGEEGCRLVVEEAAAASSSSAVGCAAMAGSRGRGRGRPSHRQEVGERN